MDLILFLHNLIQDSFLANDNKPEHLFLCDNSFVLKQGLGYHNKAFP